MAVVMSVRDQELTILRVQLFEQCKLLPRPYQLPLMRPHVPYHYDDQTKTVTILNRSGGAGVP